MRRATYFDNCFKPVVDLAVTVDRLELLKSALGSFDGVS